MVSGLLSAVLALAVPLLPVVVDEPALTWPRAGDVASVDAPLAGYVPLDVEVTILCAVATGASGSDRLVLATIPPATAQAQKYGLIVAAQAADAAGPARLEIRLAGAACRTEPHRARG